jgi:hypothetical protein
MPAGRWAVERLIDDVALLGRRALPREQYFGEVAARLRRVIDCDATCWHTLDPQTGLMTSDAPQELISEGVFTPQAAADAGAGIVASEYFVTDLNTFAHLASRRVPVGILSQATKGRPERSAGTATCSRQRGSRSSCAPRSSIVDGAGARSTSPAASIGGTSPRTTHTRSPASPRRSLLGSELRFASTPPAGQVTAALQDSWCSAPATT